MKRTLVRFSSVSLLLALVPALPAAASPLRGGDLLSAQSVLERSPNLSGTWVGDAGTVHFNFLHRFTATDDDARKVINYPTFLLGAGLPGVPGGLLVGARYSSNSDLVPGVPNEWEFFGRATPVRQTAGHPVDLSFHGGYNEAARSVDGALSLARDFGPLRLMGALRGFSNALDRDESRLAWGAGGALRLSEHVALAGDYGRMADLADDEEAAWSAALQLGVPFTPHSLSLQASNATTTTLQGSSLGAPETRWGFEFTVPITLSRYFGGRSGSGGGDVVARGETAGGGAAAEVGMTNSLEFTPPTVTIQVGETVRWVNSSDIIHTVTADPELARQEGSVSLPSGAGPFNSGDLQPGEVFEYTFTVAGTYGYVCLPHEMAGMVGTVVVEGGDR